MAPAPVASLTPPYLPFSRFLESLDSIAALTPDRIDRTFWSPASEYLSTLLVNAYAFLGLIDSTGAPTPLLHRLAADPASRPATLREVLQRAYADVLTTVSTATGIADLDDSFSQFRTSGATHRKAVTFLLQACRYAGLPVSGNLTAKTRLSHMKTLPPAAESAPETTTLRVPLRSGGELTLTGRFNPFTLSAADRRFIFRIVDELSAYGSAEPAHPSPIPDEDEVPF
jgi:hypothetical protein